MRAVEKFCGCICGAAVLMIASAGAQPAAEAADADSEFIVQSWGASDALPGNVILEIQQTPDGYLWLGTTHGLVRFDGMRFESYLAQRMPHRLGTRVEGLDVDGSGNLWIVAEQRGLVSFQKRRLIEFHTDSRALPQPTASACSDGAGWLWVVDARGNLARISVADPHRIESMDFKLRPGARLLRDGQGNIWAVSSGEVNAITAGNRVMLRKSPAAIQAAGVRRAGGLWLAMQGRLHRMGADGEIKALEALPWPPSATRVSCLFEDRDGVLWIGTTSRGLFRRKDGVITQVLAAPRSINCLMQDREGNFWAGTRGGGLARISRRVFRMVDSRSGLRNEYVNGIAEDSTGRVWLAPEENGLGWVADQRWHPLSTQEWPGRGVVCLTPSRQNGLWVATSNQGLWQGQSNRFTRLKLNLPGSVPVRCMHESGEGTLWIVLDDGALFSVVDGKPRRHVSSNGLNTRWVRTVAEDADGAIWAGDWRGGIWRFSGQSWEEIKPAASNSEAVRVMVFDGSDLWVGTAGAGLLRVRAGQVARIGRTRGLPGEDVEQMLLDGGNLWFGTGKGLFHVSMAQLNEAADERRTRIDPVRHGQSEGLPELHFTGRHQPRSWRAQNGELWFATANGALHFNPRDLATNGPPPQAILEEVLVNGQSQSRESLQRLRSDARRVEFRFTAPSFIAPEHLRFRYQLKGVDEDWVECGPNRSATYASVPFGSHVFRVAACNSAGVWGPAAESMALVVTPHFWQTHWFFAVLTASVVGGMVWGARRATLRRLRRKLQRLEQQHALERERARISQDIHDDLGASLTTIGLLADMGNRHKANPEALTQDLTQISDMARGTAAAMDAIVWALNPRNDSLDHFANYVGQFTKDFFRPTSIRTRLDVPSNLPARSMSAHARHNLFLAVKESLNNVVRHADATEVRLSLQVADNSLLLTVEDNGRGMPACPAADGQDGLVNMRERINKLSGSLVIEATPGNGTRISFSLPLTKLNTN
jgi:signal transduction histidine kinase/ligand-binding sensor domain-containing protein